MIHEFNLNYSSDQWIAYQISCYVVGSASLDDKLPTDEALGSANAQADDIVSLLQNTGIYPTEGQTSSIMTLAALNYDIAPSDGLKQANALLSSIDSQLESLDQVVPDVAANVAGSSAREAQSFLETVSNAGRRAALTLAFYRLLNVSVRAKGVNEQ